MSDKPNPMTIVLPPVETMSVAELIAKLELSDFECLGGPLKNCAEWKELKRRVEGP